jgi:hypothetical protein
MNADARVMEFFPKPLIRSESDASMAGIRAFLLDHGYGLYAAEEKSTGAFLGFIGLSRVPFEAPFTPATEIGWRLARTAWAAATPRRARARFSAIRSQGSNSASGVIHCGMEHAFAPRHGKDRYAPRPGRQLPAPAIATRAQARAPCALPGRRITSSGVSRSC